MSKSNYKVYASKYCKPNTCTVHVPPKEAKLTMPSFPTVPPLKTEEDCKCPPSCSVKRYITYQ